MSSVLAPARDDALQQVLQRRSTVARLARLPRTASGVIGAVMVVGLVLMALVGPFLVGHDPLTLNIAQKIKPPSITYPLGTDQLGRDILTRIVYGSRQSLLVALVTVVISVGLGIPIGALAGFVGGRLDNLLMRVMDAIMAFPALLLAIGLVAAIGPGLRGVMIVLGVVYIPVFARLVRAAVLTQREREYVEAAHTIGQSGPRILFRHILPNAITPALIQMTITFGEAIYLEAALSFLGLGVQPPTPSWGSMLNESRGFMQSAPHAAIFPGLVVALAVLGFNLLGDGLRDILDPRIRRV
jgi:peptide/nickel transport system permease protein